MADSASDPFNLQRFVCEQTRDYEQALTELRAGRKRTHWIWYVLPQLKGLGFSEMSEYFGITGEEEARAYLAHPVLGARLAECVEAIASHKGVTPSTILGSVDALKYQSCLTLFDAVAGPNSVFAKALQQFYGGQRDTRTLKFLSNANG